MGNWGYDSYKWSYFTLLLTGTGGELLVGAFNPVEKYAHQDGNSDEHFKRKCETTT